MSYILQAQTDTNDYGWSRAAVKKDSTVLFFVIYHLVDIHLLESDLF